MKLLTLGITLIFLSLTAYAKKAHNHNHEHHDEHNNGTPFSTKTGIKRLQVYANVGLFCKKDRDSVSYVVHTGAHEYFCALGYSYSRCQKNLINGICPFGARRKITDNKLLYAFSHIERKKECLNKAKKLAKKIEAKGFTCSESGIN